MALVLDTYVIELAMAIASVAYCAAWIGIIWLSLEAGYELMLDAIDWTADRLNPLPTGPRAPLRKGELTVNGDGTVNG